MTLLDSRRQSLKNFTHSSCGGFEVRFRRLLGINCGYTIETRQLRVIFPLALRHRWTFTFNAQCNAWENDGLSNGPGKQTHLCYHAGAEEEKKERRYTVTPTGSVFSLPEKVLSVKGTVIAYR